jgi:hypothetical protein
MVGSVWRQHFPVKLLSVVCLTALSTVSLNKPQIMSCGEMLTQLQL